MSSRTDDVSEDRSSYWNLPPADLLRALGTSPGGLTADEVRLRLSRHGHNLLGARKRATPLAQFAHQFTSPIVLILLIATGLSAVLFFDPPKSGVRDAVADLAGLGVELKIITGDNRLAARHTAEAVGLPVTGMLTGADLDDMRDEALWQRSAAVNLFAEVDPNQKERIIRALQRTGRVVGYMGDGINDAPALHTADVGISVDQAVDVAREAADFVLLDRDLTVLHQGIVQGRTTFANTLKYIFASGANGNRSRRGQRYPGAALHLPCHEGGRRRGGRDEERAPGCIARRLTSASVRGRSVGGGTGSGSARSSRRRPWRSWTGPLRSEPGSTPSTPRMPDIR